MHRRSQQAYLATAVPASRLVVAVVAVAHAQGRPLAHTVKALPSDGLVPVRKIDISLKSSVMELDDLCCAFATF